MNVKPLLTSIAIFAFCGTQVVSSLGCERVPLGRAGEDSLKKGLRPANFQLTSLDGEEKTLESYKGKLLLLNFWATWCAPCVAEMPSLERLSQAYKDQGLVVAAVSVDPPDAKEELKKFAADNGLNFDILHDPDISLPPKYGVSGFPETFFIGPDGKYVSFIDPYSKKQSVRVVSDRQWDSPIYLKAISSLLKKEGVQ